MHPNTAALRAAELVKAYVENQPMVTVHATSDNGAKAADFVATMHENLYQYFLKVKDSQ